MQIPKRSVKGDGPEGDGPEIDTAQTPKRFVGRLALPEKIRKTFTDSILKGAFFNVSSVIS